MFSKEELLSKDSSELQLIAEEMGAEYNPDADQEMNVYAILDKQAIEAGSKNSGTTKRKRTRIQKKDTDRVYSVNGKEGENFDMRKNKQTDQQPPLFKDEVATKKSAKKSVVKTETEETKAEEVAKPTTKKRGRKSKAELAAMTAANNTEETDKAEETENDVMKTEDTETVNPADMGDNTGNAGNAESAEYGENTFVAENGEEGKTDEYVENGENTEEGNEGKTEQILSVDEVFDVPEAGLGHENEDSEEDDSDTDLIAKLQAKVNAHNENETNINNSTVWSGDPGDGTDFITIVDLPIEDQGAVPTYDMFDNPTTPNVPQQVFFQSAPSATNTTQYEFDDLIVANGVLEVMPDGYGFLRSSDYNYLSSPDDVYLSTNQIKRYGLKTGDVVACHVRPPHDGEKYFPLTSIDMINGRQPAEVRDRLPFEHLTPLFPEERFNLTGDPRTTNLSTRIVDLFSPIGKGQRALIVAQPKTGKTILMKDIANAIAANHPEAYIMMLLIDERPEEVTDMARTVNAEVIASTFDEPAERHVKIAGIVLEKAKRMVECGHDVVIFLDSITRLARAYNTVAPASGKVLTGGVDANALQKPKRFFGAARNIEGGGSLTIIATALVDTGSKMDEVIFEEFKGTGNSEIQLDRSLSNKRIFPSVNLVQSSTRRDDLLQDKTTLDRMWILRKYIADMNSLEAMNTIHDRMAKTRDNDEFLLSMNA